MSEQLDKLKELLDQEYNWPAEYKFKFILPHCKLSELIAIIGEEGISCRLSGNGKYVSVTLVRQLLSGGEVVMIYKSVQHLSWE